MKKTLLGTTALVAVGLLAGPALASDPLKVTVGGNVVTGFYVVDSDDIGGLSVQDTKVAVVARNIDIIAEGTLDNGLTAGVNAKLMLGSDFSNSTSLANNNGFATFRQLFAYLEGGFGRFEIGGTDGASYKMHYTSPWFVPGNGVDSPNIYNSAAGSATRVSTFSLLATDANKVSYFTPRLAGFQLGGSYTPEVTATNVKANGLGGLTVGPVNTDEVMEVALNYAGTIGGLDLGLDGFYTTGSSSVVNADPVEYGFGANLGIWGFTLGGAFYDSEDVAAPGVSVAGAGQQVWTAGLSYSTGPWTVGAAYLEAEDETAGSNNENSIWQVGGGYALGSGVDIGVEYQFINEEAGIVDYDSQSLGLVLAVGF
ncbi:MAG: porin [Parvibaculum sp.]|nr:porin [Parvibaculum sp.]